MDLTDFLLARIAEEDQSSVHYEHCAVHYWECDCSATEQLERQLEAQRRIVERCSAVDVGMPSTHLAQGILAEMATAYADHPDYREEWRP